MKDKVVSYLTGFLMGFSLCSLSLRHELQLYQATGGSNNIPLHIREDGYLELPSGYLVVQIKELR